MTYWYYVLSIVTILQACHLMYVESLPKTFMSQDILLDFRKSYKIVSIFIGWEIGGGGGRGVQGLKAHIRKFVQV